ncbi:MAG: UvrD-helicase domain-containing protein [Pseudomonadales bacterium]|nr:UvrD-helicase domain-containing protein [Pseudomonadales bacterium]
MNTTNNMNITFISAGAGSGKTSRLTDILFDVLHHGEARAEGVIATTFTNKAAAELRERTRASLLSKSEWLLANQIGAARIGTVHSVCSELIQRFAFEAGLATDLRVLDENQTSQFIREALDKVLDEQTRQRLNQLSYKMGIQDNMTKALLWEKVVQDIIQQVRSNNIAIECLPEMASQNAQDLLSFFGTPIQDNFSEQVLNELNRVIPLLEDREQIKAVGNTTTYLGLCREMKEKLPSNYAPWAEWVKLAKGTVGAAAREIVAPLSLLTAKFLQHPQLHQDITEYLSLVFKIAADSMQEFSLRKREMAVIDFSDQEQLFLKLLDKPTVRSVLSEELDLLLVDEFQDTNPIQLSIFLKLASLAKKTYWVGDPKQSIYGFRGSDPELMMKVKNVANDHQTLGKSWRSIPSLVSLTNNVFSHTFADQFEPHDISLQAQRDNIANEQPVFMHWLLTGTNQDLQHKALASAIGQLTHRGIQIVDKNSKQLRELRYADIAILTRSNKNLASIVKALAQAHIPATTSQAGLLATPEAVLTLACLRRLNNPHDTLATAEILSLAYSQEPESWLQDRLDYLKQTENEHSMWREKAENAEPLLLTLAEYRTKVLALSPKEAIQLVITACDLSKIVLGWKPNIDKARQRLANLKQLITLANQYEEQCYNTHQAATISGLLLWLDKLSHDEGDLQATLTVNAVQVLTHHAAKGLEWPVVICNDLTSGVKSHLWGIKTISTADFNIQNPLQGRFLRYWPWPFGAQKKVDQLSVLESSKLAKGFMQAANQEEQRLLYVSMTRARDMLIFALPLRQPTDRFNLPIGSWLSTLDVNDWLTPHVNASTMQLPDGTKLSYACEKYEATLDGEAAPAEDFSNALYWFAKTNPPKSPYLPLGVVPSKMPPIKATIAEQVDIGKRITLAGSINGVAIEMDRFGAGLHACIAYAISQKQTILSSDDIRRILTPLQIQTWTEIDEVAAQLTHFLSWINSRWQVTACYAEYPVNCTFQNGQQLSGQIDLLLDTPQGWILIDHKANPSGSNKWNELAQKHSGQLAAYSQAIHQSSGQPVIEHWLYMPVAAGAIRITFDDLTTS